MQKKLKTVYSVGGLGNQLFVWAFALWLQNSTASRVLMSTAFLPQSSGKHNSFAAALPFTSSSIKYSNSAFQSYIARIGLRIGNKSTAGQLSPRVSKWMRLTKFIEVGFCGDYQFSLDGNRHQYVGYFQTYKYFDSLGITGESILEGVEAGDVKVSPSSVAIHIRHGDYRNQNQEFGILPIEYYLAGIREQIKHGYVSHIKIFGLFDSDSLGLVRELERSFPDIEFDLECLEKPQPPHVELKMLAQFPRQVISNSSYSWWGASLAPDGLKVAPGSWFRGMAEPLDLIPTTWIRVPFAWRD